MKWVSERRQGLERMDDPSLDFHKHAEALKGLARLNLWSRSAEVLWPPLRALARNRNGQKLRLLDIATGGGDIPIRLWRRARREGIVLEMEGVDKSEEAVVFAREQARGSGANVHFRQQDVLREEISGGYDVIMSSLFLHHLDNEQVVHLLRRMARSARQMILINDLVRNLFSFVLTYLGTRFLTSSEVVRTDGLRSVEAAFTLEEVQALAEKAELRGARLESHWPCRFLLLWRHR